MHNSKSPYSKDSRAVAKICKASLYTNSHLTDSQKNISAK